MSSLKKRANPIYMPSAEEDAILTAAALTDPDNPPLTDKQLSQMRPASDVLSPELFAGMVAMSKGGRPKAEQTKKAVTVRYDVDVVEQFKAGGKGWQTRMNNALREWLNTHQQSPV
jgi:uncharacterized protein (DUF4415 family)